MNLRPDGLVSAREVHDNAKLTTTFQKWGQRNFTNNPQLKEGTDYQFRKEGSPGRGRTSHEFYITPELAVSLIDKSQYSKSTAALRTKEALNNLVGTAEEVATLVEKTYQAPKAWTEKTNNSVPDSLLERVKESVEVNDLLVQQVFDHVGAFSRTVLSMATQIKDMSELLVEILDTKDKVAPTRSVGPSNMSTREVIREVINKEASTSTLGHHTVWKGLYEFYKMRHGKDLRAANRKAKRRSTLDLAMSLDLGDDLEACVQDKYTASYNAVMNRIDAVPTNARTGLELPGTRDKSNPLPDEVKSTGLVAGYVKR